MKVAIVGSRDFNDYSQLHYMIDRIRLMFKVDGFVSGGAKGADSLAETYARACKIPIEVFKPDWDTHGKAAGMIRNGEIVRAADIVVAFWDGKSRGTKNTIDRALHEKKPCFVFFTLHVKGQPLSKELSDALLANSDKAESTNSSEFKTGGCDCPDNAVCDKCRDENTPIGRG